MITICKILKTKDPPPMFDRKPIQLVFSSRTNQATDGSLTEGNHFENCWWSYPRCGGDHIQEGFGWNKSLEGSHIPDIHVNPHEVVLGVEVHVWFEALPLASMVATHPKHWAPDGEVFTNSPDHLFLFFINSFFKMIIFILLFSYNDHLVPVVILLKHDCVFVQKSSGKKVVDTE